ncbi:predicted protein [Histoplasma mississippiense (nom. inval.)]|uniref:predicted protein n=1 Tax=Ajellomyces capsulatus (strain NAm1 / WU24) TaxID=2059318 RepID=UPI000157C01D|nr:predicted protein [Histoplasma mississippiense (nom. inval.)]EDN07063.1 predicted protein [Histoplasma mississippiense (nom. inval.)]
MAPRQATHVQIRENASGSRGIRRELRSWRKWFELLSYKDCMIATATTMLYKKVMSTNRWQNPSKFQLNGRKRKRVLPISPPRCLPTRKQRYPELEDSPDDSNPSSRLSRTDDRLAEHWVLHECEWPKELLRPNPIEQFYARPKLQTKSTSLNTASETTSQSTQRNPYNLTYYATYLETKGCFIYDHDGGVDSDKRVVCSQLLSTNPELPSKTVFEVKCGNTLILQIDRMHTSLLSHDWASSHFKRLCSAIDELQAVDFDMLQQPETPHQPEVLHQLKLSFSKSTGLSQGAEGVDIQGSSATSLLKKTGAAPQNTPSGAPEKKSAEAFKVPGKIRRYY